jgi:hypothetical protein
MTDEGPRVTDEGRLTIAVAFFAGLLIGLIGAAALGMEALLIYIGSVVMYLVSLSWIWFHSLK